MPSLRQETIDTYNNSAQALADYFSGIGPRTESIDLAFQLAGNPTDARVVEIGCGDGRDAKEIVARSGWYEGFDISEGLLDIAKKNVPGANFVEADAVTYEFPQNLDIVFAFASLLHVTKDELRSVFERAHTALKTDGIFYVSLKYAPQYEERVKEDQYGRRLFYFYNIEVICELIGDNYEVAKEWRQVHGTVDWAEIVLRNK